MTETKPWWTSRTIWMGLATSIMAILSAAGILPVWLTQMMVEEIIIGVLGVLTVYFRAKAEKEIKPVLLPAIAPTE